MPRSEARPIGRTPHYRWMLATALALSACHARTADDEAAVNAAVAAQANAAAADPNAIDCAVAGATTFTQACTVDREATPRGLVLTLRNPDGAFHRLLVTQDGHGVTAADGAQPVSVVLSGTNTIEVGIARDRYRLPATVRTRSR